MTTRKRLSLQQRQQQRLTGQRGRPPGSPHRDYVRAEVALSACPACGCTDRSEYEQREEFDRGRTADGLHRFVVQRRCQCLHCHTFRIDRCTELRAV